MAQDMEFHKVLGRLNRLREKDHREILHSLGIENEKEQPRLVPLEKLLRWMRLEGVQIPPQEKRAISKRRVSQVREQVELIDVQRKSAFSKVKEEVQQELEE